MSDAGDPFDAGPFSWAPHALPLAPDCREAAWHRGFATLLIAWAPLTALSLLETAAAGSSLRNSALFDIAAQGRYLVAAPALGCAGVIALPQLARVVREFRGAELIAERDRVRYDALVESTRRLLRSRWTDATLVILAYALTFATSSLLYPTGKATWVISPSSPLLGHLSLAGWWRLLISQPLFYALFGVWTWRLFLWIRFLWWTMRMDLRLVAAHPDRLGGLRFVLVPLRGFVFLAFAMGAIAAGSVGDSVLAGGEPLASFRYLIGAQVVFVIALLAGPMLLLMGPLIELQLGGTYQYGALASKVGHAFQKRWLSDGRPSDSDALGVADFSATTDLYAIVANVDAINPLVLDLRTLTLLAVSTLLPYLPIVFAVMPLDEILQFAVKALT